MSRLSQGLKAGLAGGVIYGFVIGLLHLGTLEMCTDAQIRFITEQLLLQNPPTNATAQELFATDVVYYPMIYGLWSLLYGIIYGAAFALLYTRLPGASSKSKGLVLAVPVFLIGLFVGPGYLLYECSPAFVPYLSLVATLPVSLAFGYILGVFYDSFGRLSEEEKKEESEREYTQKIQ